ncbi:Pentatricopeptide repeat [Quillaja saponaria]|uniref:Pentatricopeptide repeat n=1 Tax=Quillaja saponaria TaxID=32244 RepID=A0AAD7KWX4_QUISA|nr:Pentatricopeptide repeat [Quillaja saponaria]
MAYAHQQLSINRKPRILLSHSQSPSSKTEILPPPRCSATTSRPLYRTSTTLNILVEPLLKQNPPRLLSYASIFQFLIGRNLLKLGQQIHGHMALRGIEPNAFLGAKMVAMYASSGDLDSAINVFNRVGNPSSLLYNSMIRAYALYRCPEKTIGTYFRMHSSGLKGDNFTYPFVLKACADFSSSWIGKCVHGQSLRNGLQFDMYVGTSLIDMYVKCGGVEDAQKLFDKMSMRDISSWNVLIARLHEEWRNSCC